MPTTIFPGKGSSLINYWTLDETSGNRLNSVGSQALVPNSSTGFGLGKRGNAAGNNTDWLGTSAPLTVSAPMSFAFWTKIFVTPITDHRPITAIVPAITIPSGTTNVQFRDGASAIITLPLGALNEWHLIVITVDASNVWRASIDNSVFVSAAGTPPVTNNLVLGVAIGQLYNGLIDEFAHWNVALSQNDVSDLWNGGSGFFFDSVMPCDPNTLLEQAKCYQCNIPPGMLAAVEIVILCAWRDGTTLSCDPQSLMSQASCIYHCIPAGMMQAVKTAILCDIASCVGPTAPSNVLALAAGALILDVSWIDNSSDETGFDVRWRNLTTAGAFVDAPSEPANATTSTLDASGGSVDGDLIEVQVRASGVDCDSAWVSAPPVIITDTN